MSAIYDSERRRLPIEPLLAFAGSYRQVALRSGLNVREVYRDRIKGGLTVVAADRAACAFGLHPAEIWPEEWAEIEAEALAEVRAAEDARRERKRARERHYQREWSRRRYQSDPEWAERQRQRLREARPVIVAKQRLRYQNDPDYRERRKREAREYRARKRQEADA